MLRRIRNYFLNGIMICYYSACDKEGYFCKNFQLLWDTPNDKNLLRFAYMLFETGSTRRTQCFLPPASQPALQSIVRAGVSSNNMVNCLTASLKCIKIVCPQIGNPVFGV